MKAKKNLLVNNSNQAAVDLRESEAKYRFLFANNPQPMWIYDFETLAFLEINEAAIQLYGYSREEFMQMAITDIRPEEDRFSSFKDLEWNREDFTPPEDWIHIKKDGEIIFVEITSHSMLIDGRNARYVLVKDITGRKQAENKLRHVTRLYALLSQINQAIVQIKDREALFLKICQVAIDYGEFRMAWIGMVDEAGLRFKPVAHAGHEEGYLDQINIAIGKLQTGQGPTGLAFQEGKIIISPDIATDPRMLPWRENALVRGYRSSASVPFRCKGKTVGSLGLYAKDSGFFTDDEQALLHEIGEDISFALDAMASQTESKLVQLALSDSESRYRGLFESSKDGILILDAETGQITDVNPYLIELLGDSEFHYLGRTIWEIGYFKALVDNYDHFLELQQREYIYYDDLPIETTNGRKINVEIVSNVYWVNTRKVIQCHIRDITKRKQAEETLVKLSQAVEQTINPILITDREGTIEYVNHAFEVLTGYSSQEALGKTPRILKSGVFDQKYYEHLWETILAGQIYREEILNRKKNGDLYEVEETISPIFDQNRHITHFVGTGVDLTHRKRTEEELIKAKEKAEESDRLKSAFLANMSHEVRTPLNSIIRFSELLADPDFEAEQKNEFIELIVTNGNQLLAIISDIMDLSKMEAGEIVIRKSQVNAGEFISSIRDQFAFQAEAKNLALQLRLPAADQETVIFADADRLSQIFNNLVGNAIKFTDNGHIEIGYRPCGQLVEFYVRDTGIGIAKAYHARIFERFRQVDESNRRIYGGNGLGLAICKYLVEVMGGEMGVESEPGKGSVFYFTLPCC
ncbi:MAG TPA: PAS domain S-box protein [Prolixibacteraceae bacterium]